MGNHEVLQKMNFQSHQNAAQNADEFIMENFVTFEKMPELVGELIAIEAWKERVFPLIKDRIKATSSMRVYFMVCPSLLKIVQG